MTHKDIIRLLKEKGINETINYLTQENFSKDVRNSLEKEHILIDGCPCLSVLYYLNNSALD